MGITGIDHIVLRVNDIDAAISSFEGLGMKLTKTGENPAVGKQAFFRLDGGFFFELVAPLTPDSPVGQALERRGEGVHTVALAVDDHDATRADLVERGAPVIDGGDLPVSFIHPKAAHGIMLQVMEQNPNTFED
jgi:methylmalonyl-CoA/ethylmalonyl-CoA epimerase